MNLTEEQIESQKLIIYVNISKDPAQKKFRPVIFPHEIKDGVLSYYQIKPTSIEDLKKPKSSKEIFANKEDDTELELVTYRGSFYVVDQSGKQIYSSESSIQQ